MNKGPGSHSKLGMEFLVHRENSPEAQGTILRVRGGTPRSVV